MTSTRIKCPVHECFTPGGDCPRCNEQGISVIECEIDKISRTIDTMVEQGYILDPRGRASYAVLVFTNPFRTEFTKGDLVSANIRTYGAWVNAVYETRIEDEKFGEHHCVMVDGREYWCRDDQIRRRP